MKARFIAALAEADKAFAATDDAMEPGDAMEALGWVAFAAKAGLPLPPRIGAWLYKAITKHRAGDPRTTLDVALGLVRSGKASPRRKLREDSARQGQLARMMVLQTIGATIPQAAALVARLSPDFTVATLISRYRRGGCTALVMRDRPPLLHWHPTELEKILSEYPDQPIEVSQAKAAIRDRHAKAKKAMYARHCT